MLRWISLAVVIIGVVGAATFMNLNATVVEPTAHPAPVTSSGPAPKVLVSEPLTHEFGMMPQLTTGTHAWEFKNLGDAELELWFESSTCSCTVAKLKTGDGEEKKKLVVPPGKSTKIDLEWQTKEFHDDYSKGAVIGTNDPSCPTVSINVHGTVHAPVIVFPPEMINFESVSNEEAQRARFAIFSVDRPQTKILKLTNSRPEYFVTTPEPLTPDECKQLKVTSGTRVTVDMKPGMPLGRFLDELVIETDHPLKPVLKISIAGNITGSIAAIPDRLRLPGVSANQGASRDLTLLVRGGKPTRFEVAYHPEKIEVKITTDDTATQKGRYKMTVTVPPGTAPGPVEGEIVLKTDHPSVRELRIPVSILISSSGAG
jgi:Protein of unknown function (DUF1573)